MRFVKGQSGNPNGRPKKGKTLTDILKAELDKRSVRDENGEPMAGKKALAKAIISMCFDARNVEPATRLAALKYIYDRIDGKPDIFQNIVSEMGVRIVAAAHDENL